MDKARRKFIQGAAFLGAGLLAANEALAAQQTQEMPGMQHMHPGRKPTAPEQAVSSFSPPGIALPVETPDVPKLPWQMDNGAKVFHLVAETVKREFLPGDMGKTADAWGFNGSVPGPTIEVNQGDRVRIIVDNHLPEATSMHWHGFEIPIEMDGVPGISQELIPPGGRYIYEFTLHQHGTFFYHSHMAMQEMIGMIGLFIMHPKTPYRPRVDKDFGLILQEWAILPNNSVPNTLSMEFNWLTINGKAGPATTPLIVKLGDRVRIRLVNLGMDHHPIHLHGNTFYVTGTEAGRAPETTWRPENTVLVGVAQARDIEFEAKYPGDWMLHCHLPHHMMNQMASMVGPVGGMHRGMHTGMSMENGMGMLGNGGALSEEFGPSLGRAIGLGADFERASTNAPLQSQHAGHQMQHEMKQEKELVPGFPQDMFMPMDEAVAKPETHGLRPGWSGGMMGMMTLVRVLPPELYEKVTTLKKQQMLMKPDTKPVVHKHQQSGQGM